MKKVSSVDKSDFANCNFLSFFVEKVKTVVKKVNDKSIMKNTVKNSALLIVCKVFSAFTFPSTT